MHPTKNIPSLLHPAAKLFCVGSFFAGNSRTGRMKTGPSNPNTMCKVSVLPYTVTKSQCFREYLMLVCSDLWGYHHCCSSTGCTMSPFYTHETITN